MSDSEINAVERILASGVQSALDGFRQNAFSLTFPAGNEGKRRAGATQNGRKRGFSSTSPAYAK